MSVYVCATTFNLVHQKKNPDVQSTNCTMQPRFEKKISSKNIHVFIPINKTKLYKKGGSIKPEIFESHMRSYCLSIFYGMSSFLIKINFRCYGLDSLG